MFDWGKVSSLRFGWIEFIGIVFLGIVSIGWKGSFDICNDRKLSRLHFDTF